VIKAGPLVPLWLLTLGAGIVAGALSGLAGEATGRAIPLNIEYPAGFARMGGYQKDAVLASITVDALRVAERKRAAVAYGLLGGLLGVGLGVAGGAARRSFRSGLGGAVLGGLTGAAAGAALSAAVVPIFFRFEDPETDATITGLLVRFFTHAAIFAGVGAAGGLALGWGLGDKRSIGRALFAGLLGAVFGTLAFEVISTVAFPFLRTYDPVPSEPIPRMVAHLCVAVGTAVLAGMAAGAARTRPSVCAR